MEKRFYTSSEISIYLGVSESAIRKWVRLGRIPFNRFCGTTIRFDIKIIEKWIEKNRERNQCY